MRICQLLLVVTALLVLSIEGHAQQQQQPPPFQEMLKVTVIDLYIGDFRNEFKLTDDQFFKVNFPLRHYMTVRFELGAARGDLTQRLDRLNAQPNPSRERLRALLDDRNEIDRQIGNAENKLLEMIGTNLTNQQLVSVVVFNRKYFEERLPKLVEMVRANPPSRQQAPGPQPPIRPNAGRAPQNQGPNTVPVETFQPGKQR